MVKDKNKLFNILGDFAGGIITTDLIQRNFSLELTQSRLDTFNPNYI